MRKTQKIIKFVLDMVETLETEVSTATAASTLAILKTSLTAINRAIESVPSYAIEETINAILGTSNEENKTDES